MLTYNPKYLKILINELRKETNKSKQKKKMFKLWKEHKLQK